MKIKKIYSGRVLGINMETARLPDGREVDLEIIRHPGGSCILPLYDNGDVMLIRQFRHAAGGIIWEVPAGRIDEGDTPESCAERELREEGGVTAGRMEKIAEFFTTPGFCTEMLHIFLARDLKECGQSLEADEYLETVRMPLEEAVEMVHRGEIKDSKTMLALLMAHRKITE